MSQAESAWVVVRTFAGHEAKVKTRMESELKERESLRAKIKEILVPIEKVYEVKDGKKVSRNKNFFPGYLLLQTDIDAQVIEFILSVPAVMGFLGNNRYSPTPLRPDEVKRLIGRIKQEDGERSETIFRNGDTVKIINGPFNNFTGTIEEVYEEKMKIKVLVPILGRKTPVELDFVQAELQK